MADSFVLLARIFPPRGSTRVNNSMHWRKSMNVHVRFISVATLAALAAGAPLAAQSASLPDSDNVSVAIAAPIAVPTALGNVSGGPVSATGAGVTVTPEAPAERSGARGPSLAAARVASHAVSAPIGAPRVIQTPSTKRKAVGVMAVGGGGLG